MVDYKDFLKLLCFGRKRLFKCIEVILGKKLLMVYGVDDLLDLFSDL